MIVETMIKQLIDFRQKLKFTDSEWHKRGLNPSDSELCSSMESLLNECVDTLVNSLKEGKTINFIKDDLLSGFSRFERMNYDTEESEFICDYFYELSQILGINIGDDLNNWIE